MNSTENPIVIGSFIFEDARSIVGSVSQPLKGSSTAEDGIIACRFEPNNGINSLKTASDSHLYLKISNATAQLFSRENTTVTAGKAELFSFDSEGMRGKASGHISLCKF